MLPLMFRQLSGLVLIVLLISPIYTCDHCGSHHHGHDHDHHYDHHHHHHHDHDYHAHSHKHQQNHKDPSPVPVESEPRKQAARKQPQLQMISDKPRLLQTMKLTPITVFFYGNNTSPEYQQFTQVIPVYNDQFFSRVSTQIQFAFISSQKFKLARPNPSLSIYRNINNGQWLMYRGIFEERQILNWITNNVVDPLHELTGEELDEFFVQGKKGFILLDFGQFYLLKPKIMISQFCQKFELSCGKVSHTNKALNMIIQLMRVQREPGIPKLSYWNPKTQQLEIYTKDVGHITQTQLMQLYSGHESVIPYESELDVAKVIHPETQIIEVKSDDPESEL